MKASKLNIFDISIFGLCFLNQISVCLKKSVIFNYKYHIYFFQLKYIATFFEMCVFSQGLNLKNWALVGILVFFLFHLFLDNLGVLNSSLSNDILYF